MRLEIGVSRPPMTSRVAAPVVMVTVVSSISMSHQRRDRPGGSWARRPSAGQRPECRGEDLGDREAAGRRRQVGDRQRDAIRHEVRGEVGTAGGPAAAAGGAAAKAAKSSGTSAARASGPWSPAAAPVRAAR